MLFLSDGSDLVGVHRPQDIKYMKRLRLVLLALGAWPGKLLGEEERLRFPHQCFNVFLSFSCFALGILFVRNNVHKLSFFEMGETYITVLMNVVCFTRYASFFLKKYNATFVDFVENIHLFNLRNTSPYAMKTHLYIHKISDIFAAYTMVLSVLAPVFFNIASVYINISEGGFSQPPPTNFTYEHAVYYELPFDYQHNFTGFIIVFVFNWYISYMCGLIICYYDFIMALLMFHLWGHLKILIYNLENFPRPGFKAPTSINKSDLNYSDEEMLDVVGRLKNIMEHHNLILRYTKEISNTCGFNIFVYYAFHQVTGCLLFLECSQMDLKALVRFGPTTVGLTQLMIQMSVIFELLSSMNDPLTRAVYNLPWEYMDTKSRKLVLMMLRQTQFNLGLKAMGMVEVGCRTMAAILKTTITYFLLLRTIATNE